MTTSSASTSQPDRFHSAFSISLRLRDTATGKWGRVTFKGTIDGTLTADDSHLTLHFHSPLKQSITLGHHVYTVTLPAALHPSGPNDVPTPVYAFVQVSQVSARHR
jgi:hypothetical protein